MKARGIAFVRQRRMSALERDTNKRSGDRPCPAIKARKLLLVLILVDVFLSQMNDVKINEKHTLTFCEFEEMSFPTAKSSDIINAKL